GGAVMLVALLLLSRVTADTALWLVMICMTLMGLGLGWSMQPIVTAAQNAASPREIGVATSSVTFFRSMGGTIGAAAFLSVLFAKLPGNIAAAYGKAVTSSDFVTAARSHPDQIRLLQSGGGGGGGGNLADTSFLSRLDPAIAHPFKVGFAD